MLLIVHNMISKKPLIHFDTEGELDRFASKMAGVFADQAFEVLDGNSDG